MVSQPIVRGNEFRVSMTASCRDTDSIPKVEQAGQLIYLGNDRVQIMHNGLKVVADGYYGDWMTTLIQRLKGHHEPQEELVFHNLIRFLGPTATIVELGGFWSYYSLWFKKNEPARTAIVIEPDPNHLAVGKRNADLNKTVIHFVQASVGDACFVARPFQTESSGIQMVAQTTVPRIAEINNLAYLDLLHCDIQGNENLVLKSCETMFRQKQIGFCMISTHSHHISGDPLTHQKCLELILDFGGHLLAEHDVHESFSGDGLISAYFGGEPLDWKPLPISRNRYSTSLFRNPLYDLADFLTNGQT